MTFTHTGNAKPGIVIPIPISKNYTTFDKNTRKYKWLESILHFIQTNVKKADDTYVPTWLVRHVYKSFPHLFVQVAVENGLYITQSMNETEAAAMWTDANISFNQAKIILRHLYNKFKTRIQVPLSNIHVLSNVTDYITPTFSSFVFKKKGVNWTKLGEKIHYWTYCPCTLIELDMARLLLSMHPQMQSFGYDSNIFGARKKGVICIIGSDHGAGKSRYLIRTNYLPSSERRRTNKVDAGTRTLQFCEVKCKKDTHEIQSKIAPTVNKAIQILHSSLFQESSKLHTEY